MKKFLSSYYLIFLLIAILTAAVYSPSLFHLSKGDHEAFLVESYGDKSLQELVTQTYSYTRSRTIAVGDQILFRPLFYLMLTLERWVWGYHFFLWQLVGLVCHLLVLWQAYRVLNLISAGIFGAGLLGLFAITHLSCEMIIWHHISPYLLAVFLILKSLERIILFLKEPDQAKTHISKIVFYMTLGVFIYEYCLVAAMVFLVAVCFLDRRNSLNKKSWSEIFWQRKTLGIPLLSYGLISSVDYLLRSETFKTTEVIKATFGQVLATLLKIISLSWLGPLIPTYLPIAQVDARSRLKIEAYSLESFVGQFNSGQLTSQLNLVLLILLIVWLLIVVIRHINFKRFLSKTEKSEIDLIGNTVGWISLALSLGYILMLAFGRLYTRGEEYLLNSLYHFYPIILFNLIFILAWRKKIFLSWQKDLSVLTLLILVLAIGLNGFQTFQTNQTIAQLAKRDRAKEAVTLERYYFCLKENSDGLTYSRKSDYKSALNYFNRAIEANPNYEIAYNNRGIVFKKTNVLELALRDYNKSIQLNPFYYKGYSNRGNVYFANHQLEKALRDFSLAILLAPEFSEAYVNRGILYSTTNRFDEALKDYNQAIEIDPTYYEAFHNRALIYFRSGQYDSAISDFKKALSLNPAYSEGYNELGAVFFEMQRYEESSEQFKLAIGVDPFFDEGHLNLGHCYNKLGMHDLALEEYNRFINNVPDSATAYYHRSLILQIKMQYQKALDDALKAKSLGFAVSPEYLVELKNQIMGLQEKGTARN